MVNLVDLSELSIDQLVKVSHELDKAIFPDDSIIREHIPDNEPIVLHIIGLNVSVRIAMTKILEETFNL